MALGPVLLADDCLRTREQLRVVLGRMGFFCIEVQHGRDALACLLRPRLPVSLLVIDGGLTGASELLTSMHSDRRLCTVPVVITTDQAVTSHAGDPPVIRKPINENEFAHTIAMIFARQLPTRLTSRTPTLPGFAPPPEAPPPRPEPARRTSEPVAPASTSARRPWR